MYIWEESGEIGDSLRGTFRSVKLSGQKLFSVEDCPSFTTMKSGLMQISQEQEIQKYNLHWKKELNVSFNHE